MIFNAYVSCLQAEKMGMGQKRELQTAIINKAIDRLPSGKLKITEDARVFIHSCPTWRKDVSAGRCAMSRAGRALHILRVQHG